MIIKRRVLTLAAGFVMLTGPVIAADMVASNCTSCHASKNGELWGPVSPGSQTDDGFTLKINDSVYTVKYDNKTELKKFFSAKQLRDDKSVEVVPRSQSGNIITADSISYKDNISFIKPEMIMELDELSNLLKKDPKEANYVLFDVRGYGDYIDGHLPRAVSLPYYRMIKFKDRLPKDKDTQIITYCNSYG